MFLEIVRNTEISFPPAVGSASSDSDFFSTDPRELRAEVSKLRRQLAKVEESRFVPLHPRETAVNIFLGKRVALEFYKSFRDKADLVDAAVDILCPNAILAVSRNLFNLIYCFTQIWPPFQATTFAHKTLSRSKFLELISTRPVALKYLIDYLEERGSIGELSDLLTSLGRQDQAAIIHYRSAPRFPLLRE